MHSSFAILAHQANVPKLALSVLIIFEELFTLGKPKQASLA
jgi:hypothetical protein